MTDAKTLPMALCPRCSAPLISTLLFPGAELGRWELPERTTAAGPEPDDVDVENDYQPWEG